MKRPWHFGPTEISKRDAKILKLQEAVQNLDCLEAVLVWSDYQLLSIIEGVVLIEKAAARHRVQTLTETIASLGHFRTLSSMLCLQGIEIGGCAGHIHQTHVRTFGLEIYTVLWNSCCGSVPVGFLSS